MATTKSTTPKVAYIYKESSPPGNGTWHPVAGLASTTVPYSWTSTHSFADDVTFTDVVNAKAGINNFQNATARDAAIASPSIGTVCFLRDNNQIQYYSGTAWVNYYDAQLVEKTSNYVIVLADSGKAITMNSSSANTVTVPTNATAAFPIGTLITVFQTGTGATSFVEASGVTIHSKNSYKTIYTQYSAAQLLKTDTNIWILAGDLKA